MGGKRGRKEAVRPHFTLSANPPRRDTKRKNRLPCRSDQSADDVGEPSALPHTHQVSACPARFFLREQTLNAEAQT